MWGCKLISDFIISSSSFVVIVFKLGSDFDKKIIPFVVLQFYPIATDSLKLLVLEKSYQFMILIKLYKI